MSPNLPNRQKKALVVGLGVLGGGVATTKWLLRRGYRVTVTDLRPRTRLTASIRALGAGAKRIRFVLGKHRMEDFRSHDLVVANPAVPRESPHLAAARMAGREVTNDARIFLNEFGGSLIAVTGTRGKTTTVNWTAHLMRGEHPRLLAGGNSSADMPLLRLLDEAPPETPAVIELSSWQLELVPGAQRAPDVAVITNFYRDHMNRYRNIRAYASAKANIFTDQTAGQALILNAEDAWTPFFLKRKPRGRVFFVSMKPLPKSKQGIFVDDGAVYARIATGPAERVLSRSMLATLAPWGDHNIRNLLTALIAGRLAGVPWKSLVARVRSLPAIPYRQEIVYRDRRATVVNDSAGTSPDATIAALQRFRNSSIILLTGGTDKRLEFGEWAKEVKRHVPSERLLLLGGSATNRMIAALRRVGYFRRAEPQAFETLPAVVRAAQELITHYPLPFTVLLFSPGAASFEKFKNEFDRGRRFNVCVRRVFRKPHR